MVTKLTLSDRVAMARQLLFSGRDIFYDFTKLTSEEQKCFNTKQIYDNVVARCFVLLKNFDQAWIVDNINVDLFETLEEMEEKLHE